MPAIARRPISRAAARLEQEGARRVAARLVRMALTSAAATGASILVERALARGWEATTGHDTPEEDDRHSWLELVAWTAGSAAVLAVVRLGARTLVEEGWERVT